MRGRPVTTVSASLEIHCYLLLGLADAPNYDNDRSRLRPSHPEQVCLYRLFNWHTELLLYVGITRKPLVRFAQHAREKTWSGAADFLVAEWWESRRLASIAELVAIRDERPLFNIWPCADADQPDGLERAWERNELYSADGKDALPELGQQHWTDRRRYSWIPKVPKERCA